MCVKKPELITIGITVVEDPSGQLMPGMQLLWYVSREMYDIMKKKAYDFEDRYLTPPDDDIPLS